MTIWVNTIVNNEENFLWFAVMSVVDYVDKVLIYDTGSTDRTVDIIRQLKKAKGEKIQFQEVGELNSAEFSKMRQRMLEESKADWILVLDGDEIWWEDSIKKVISEINQKKEIDGVVVPMFVPVGDIFHLQDESAGKYNILGKRGHLSLKLLNKHIRGLHVDWPYGKEGFFDSGGKLVQERERIVFIEAPFLHVTHLRRSSKKRKYEKFKYELGNKVKEGFKFPEVLYKKYPEFISSPWAKISGGESIKAKILTPLRKIKRIIV